MGIEIKRRRPISFGIKVGIAVIVGSIVLGALLRLNESRRADRGDLVTHNEVIGSVSSTVLVPVIQLAVDSNAPESEWTKALAKEIGGQTEVQVDRGRVDVTTDAYAIEVDFVKKWHEGLGQTIHYGSETDLIGVLALIDQADWREDVAHLELLKKIERLCTEKGIKLVILRAINESS